MARSEQLPPVYNDHNVYILGAGFSQDAGLPVISTFMDKMRESPSWLAEHDYARENEAVQRVLKFRLDSAAAAYRVDIDPENIEQLFSLAAATEENDLDRHITLAIAATLEYARSIAPRRTCRFSNITQASSGPTPSWWHIDASFKDIRCELYDFYLGVMTNCWKDPAPGIRNTLVTFNYDLLSRILSDGWEYLMITVFERITFTRITNRLTLSAPSLRS